jgi:hypothetical protein
VYLLRNSYFCRSYLYLQIDSVSRSSRAVIQIWRRADSKVALALAGLEETLRISIAGVLRARRRLGLGIAIPACTNVRIKTRDVPNTPSFNNGVVFGSGISRLR